ncbi:MAG: hypothetical protein R2826_10690 [Thermoleophilia bacterium]
MTDAHQHQHQTPGSPLEPAIDAASGKLEWHCSICGISVSPGEEFCQVCAIEASGGEVPDDLEDADADTK